MHLLLFLSTDFVNSIQSLTWISFKNIYSGEASFNQERMKDFLKIGKDLQIKEINEVPKDDEMTYNGENMVEKTHQDLISEEVSRENNDSVDENEFERSIANYETSQHISVPSNLSQCPQCNSVFKHRHDMLRHVRVHEGVKYSCSQCVYKATRQTILTKHIESVHEGIKYPCSHCDYKATVQSNLNRHIKSMHQL